MCKIVAILTSPRRDGTSSVLADAVIDGAMGLSTNLIEIHSINKLNFIKGCQDCGECKDTGICTYKDDILPVLESIRTADALIIALPIYFGLPCAQYKILKDRMFCFLDRDMESMLPPGKRIVVIVSYKYDRDSAEAVADRIESDFIKTFKCVPFGKIVCKDNGIEELRKEKTTIQEAMGIGFGIWKA